MVKEEKQLIGIKAIAKYLDMSVRNVYYWEKKLGLPLHRLSGSTGYRIYANKEEIDQWLKEKDVIAIQRTKNKKIFLPAIISIFILMLLSFLFISLLENDSTGPEMFSVDKNIIYVKNSKGNILWNFVCDVVVKQEDLKLILDIENVDDDTQKEVIAGTYDIQNDKYSITLFDHDGRIIWKRMISTNETFFKIKIKNFFRPSPVKFARSNVKEIFVISKWNHMERFLGVIACYDLEGNLLHQYLHVGNLIQIRLIPWIFEGAEPGRQLLQIHYVFDMNFTLKRILAPPVTLEKYPELLKKGDIDITLEELLKIYSRIVFRWESDRWVPVKSNIPN